MFFDDQLNLKLGGFEVASWGSEEFGGWQRGTPYFKGPEKWIGFVEGVKPNAVDIWPVGIIRYCLTNIVT